MIETYSSIPLNLNNVYSNLDIEVIKSHANQYTKFMDKNIGENKEISIIYIVETDTLNIYRNLTKDSEQYILSQYKAFCLVFWDKGKNICFIDNLYINNNVNQNLSTYRSFLSTILKTLYTTIPNTILLVINIDIKLTNFMMHVDVITSFGFKNPYIDFKDLNNNDVYTFGLLYLSKKNNNINNFTNDKTYTINYITYLIEEYNNILLNDYDKKCKLKCKFNTLYLKWAEELVLYGGNTLNENNNTITQKETASKIMLIPTNQNNEIIWEIKIDTENMIFGTEINVLLPGENYFFHTHPSYTYIHYNKSIMVPSGQDYFAFFKYFFLEESRTFFTCVFSKEGVYIISLSNEAIKDFDRFRSMQNKVMTYYSQEYENYFFTHYQIDNITDPKLYCTHMNNNMEIQFEGQSYKLYNVQFYYWKELHEENKIIEIYYRSEENQCFPNDEIYSFFKQFKNKLNDNMDING
jgi:hypothetical protein